MCGFYIYERFAGFSAQKLFRKSTEKNLPVRQGNVNNAIKVKIQEPDRQSGGFSAAKRWGNSSLIR